MSTNKKADKKCDVLIVGGGMVGASLACSLASKMPALKIVLVDAFPIQKLLEDHQGNFQTNYTPSFDSRSTVLSQGSARIFETMGLWEELSKKAEPIKTINVSEKGKFANVRLRSSEYGVNAFGYVTDNKWIGGVLLQAVNSLSNIELIAPAKIKHLNFLSKVVEAEVELKSELGNNSLFIETDLLIVSDGANSQTCQLMGVEYEGYDYQQLGLIANVTTQLPHKGHAYERFTKDGPIALLPLKNESHEKAGQGDGGPLSCRSALILTADSSQEHFLRNCDDESIAKLIEDRFGRRLGEIIEVGKRDIYPLKLVKAVEQVRNNVVVLGNAAHTLHPVAGQGFNLSMRDISELSRLIHLASKNKQRLGDIGYLKNYTLFRQLDQTLTIEFSDKLNKLFAQENVALSLGRNLGLFGLDAFPVARKLFVKQTMGMQAVY